jgi:hypothetical protein
MRQFAAILLVLVASNAWAYRGRPGSDLRFDGRGSTSKMHVASDGTDFVVLSSAGLTRRERVFTQKVVDGTPVGPHRQIGSGGGVALIWTGTSYLAGWTDDAGLWAGSVSRDGSPLATPAAPAVTGDAAYLAANRQSGLAFGYTELELVVRPLDLDGNPTGPAVTHAAPTARANVTVAPAANGFAAVFSGWNGTWLMLFRANGTAITSGPLLLDGPYGGTTTHYHSTIARVATDGTDTLVVLGAGTYEGGAELKSIVVGANGAIESTRVIHADAAGDADTFAPIGLIWDGSRYLVAVSARRDRNGEEVDPALLQISRGGERIGNLSWLTEDAGRQLVTSLGWNGRELLLPMFDPATWPNFASFCVEVSSSTLQMSEPKKLARTLASQERLTVAAGDDGHLAAWFERADGVTTVRASRIDADGNYLDGEGIVLDTPALRDDPTIAIDGNGAKWLVVWSDGINVRGRFVSRGGTAAPGTIAIGHGSQAAVRWNGSRYLVLHSDGSLHSTVVSANGVVGETKTLAESEQLVEGDGMGFGEIRYLEPRLVLLAGHLVGVYAKERTMCWIGTPGSCGTETTVTGLRLEQPAAAPFVIAENTWGDLAVAESPAQALVTWSQYQSLRGAFLSAGAPEQPGPSFRIDGTGSRSSVAFDGSDFVAAWWLYDYQAPAIATARISSAGAVGSRTTLRTDGAETVQDPAVAASPRLPALVGFVSQHPAYDDVPRASFLFPDEFDDNPAPPPAPSIVCATKNDDGTITVRWRPAHDVLGVSIELQLPDGTFRPVAVAAGDATSARVALPGLAGEALRVRTWNAGGLSAPSAIAQGAMKPRAEMRRSVAACAGVPVTIEIALSGTPPFTLHWQDGLVQSNVRTSTATRTVTLTEDTTLTIASVADASCATSDAPESVRIDVAPQPAIAAQTGDLRITSGQTATLTVAASDDADVAWFEGVPGDMSRPVGTGSRSYTTPALTSSMRYWVRVSNHCGSVDSAVMNVTVSGKRRAARR